ncbi:LOW QUALITY PROTEIN: U8 snoRNA-decapping enzyme-like [Melanerpes formicivorus]|uniref:LOW QUALITY PROTEIN: U8 snoRNA-decapping enzyme-like n=1 Tax=Melanerpes formicivorus TaxID=211600 RepID=UPI00358E912F
MQLRFDGRFGFPGGFVEPGGESLEAALQRELQEELGPAAAALSFSRGHHRGARAWPAAVTRGGGGGGGGGVVTHFYVRRLTLGELVRIERGGPAAPEHGLEVQGLVRVPLGGGLEAFLGHGFAGDAREQLLGTLPLLGVCPPGAAAAAAGGGGWGRPHTPGLRGGEELPATASGS